ncbi:MaoC/PaaZ C-terminal domain-containing protein [Sphingomonas profundi]|uniref:MaoC/PaaZ C-terminal domain-containing protein n=1 Tax=Alterirhizorhabdus profundi TaxID=2681549 RepID=UPI0012E81D7F|nr:MaoC/PaaZ C-terminal domain-containing protein [Sphingomonas profundi]
MIEGVRIGDVTAGDILPEISLRVTYEKIVMTPMATWDLFPGHSDPFFAQQQGQQSIYLNTLALQGFADRVATDWAGPATFVARRKMVMKASVYPGDTLTGSGRVVGHAVEGGRRRIDLVIRLATQAGTVCDVQSSILLPVASA